MNISAISLLQLIEKNSDNFNKNSTRTNIVKVSYKKTKKNLFVFLAKSSMNYSNPKGHIVSLYFMQTEGQILQSDVKVNCTCPAYTYWGPKYNATEGKYNYTTRTKKQPNIRDPKRKNKICKHIVAARQALKGLTFNKSYKKFRATASETTHYTALYEQLLESNPPLQNIPLTSFTDSVFENIIYNHYVRNKTLLQAKMIDGIAELYWS